MYSTKTGIGFIALILFGSVCNNSRSAEFAYEENVRNISLRGMKVTYLMGGKQNEPSIFKSVEELAKDEGLKDAAETIEQKVDFSNEKLVLFRWAGSRGDAIAAEQGSLGVFWISQSDVRNYGFHLYLFAVPKNAAVKVLYKR